MEKAARSEDVGEIVRAIGAQAKEAARALSIASPGTKDTALQAAAASLRSLCQSYLKSLMINPFGLQKAFF